MLKSLATTVQTPRKWLDAIFPPACSKAWFLQRTPNDRPHTFLLASDEIKDLRRRSGRSFRLLFPVADNVRNRSRVQTAADSQKYSPLLRPSARRAHARCELVRHAPCATLPLSEPARAALRSRVAEDLRSSSHFSRRDHHSIAHTARIRI